MASMKKCWLLYIVFKTAVTFSFCISPCLAELPRFEHSMAKENSLSLLAVGDWGRKGENGQAKVAKQMGIIGEKMKIDMVISTGDNFYRSGLHDADDEAFIKSYVKVYTALSLQGMHTLPTPVLGNRDYRGDAVAQLTGSKYHRAGKGKQSVSEVDQRWFCYRSYVVHTDTELAELFFVDTTPLVKKYIKNPGPHKYDWRGVEPHEQYNSNLLGDLTEALRTSKRKWKIVIGHHTIKSAGEKGDTQELIDHLLPILKENKVDFYINGHEHLLQYILDTESGIHLITSGAGSKTTSINHELQDPAYELKFHHGGEGFVSMQLTSSEAEFIFYNGDGEVLREFTVSKKAHDV